MNAKMMTMKYLLPFLVMLVLVALMRHISTAINTGNSLKAYYDLLKLNKKAIITSSDILLSLMFVSLICCMCKGSIVRCGIISFILFYVFSVSFTSYTDINVAAASYNVFVSKEAQKTFILIALGFALAASGTYAIFRKQMM